MIANARTFFAVSLTRPVSERTQVTLQRSTKKPPGGTAVPQTLRENAGSRMVQWVSGTWFAAVIFVVVAVIAVVIYEDTRDDESLVRQLLSKKKPQEAEEMETTTTTVAAPKK